MRTGNPALNANTFEQVHEQTAGVASSDSTMTLNGTVWKSSVCLALVVAAASWTWRLYFVEHAVDTNMLWTIGGAIGGFIVAMITVFKKQAAPVTAPLYAVLEGFFLGGISAIFEQKYPGVVIQAVGLTFGTFGALLMAYVSGLIKPSENFKLGVVAATGGVAILYLVTLGLSFFHINVPYIYESGPIGIGFSVLVVIIAAMNLVLDFDFIEQGSEMNLPKYMEWYAAFGLTVTLCWLYLEILRLLSKIRGRK